MDERLRKQWAVTTDLLQVAAAEVSSAAGYSEYCDYIKHNELELALNVLQDIGANSSVSSDYWRHLKKAAEVMGLQEHYADLHSRLREARNAS